VRSNARAVRDGTFIRESIQLVMVRASSATAWRVVHGASSGIDFAIESSRLIARPRQATVNQPRPLGMSPR
jgi:hypothetical protein